MTQGFPRRRLRMVLEVSQLFPGRREAEALNQGVAQDEGPAAMVPDGPQTHRNNNAALGELRHYAPLCFRIFLTV